MWPAFHYWGLIFRLCVFWSQSWISRALRESQHGSVLTGATLPVSQPPPAYFLLQFFSCLARKRCSNCFPCIQFSPQGWFIKRQQKTVVAFCQESRDWGLREMWWCHGSHLFSPQGPLLLGPFLCHVYHLCSHMHCLIPNPRPPSWKWTLSAYSHFLRRCLVSTLEVC